MEVWARIQDSGMCVLCSSLCYGIGMEQRERKEAERVREGEITIHGMLSTGKLVNMYQRPPHVCVRGKRARISFPHFGTRIPSPLHVVLERAAVAMQKGRR